MNKKRGKLKIFLGYAAGVGKTYAMLKETHEQLALGKDIVVGYIEPHDRPETKRLIDGLECIKTIDVHYKGRVFQELHLNAIIERMPECVVIDELAHSNTPGLRHEKRFGDIEELLNRGVDVYTTINIQHIESLHDLVESITGIPVNERVPDWMIDRADEIQLVDLEPSVLIQRLKDGKIYAPERAKQALQNFFTLPHLIALREIALRRIADSVHKRIPLEHAKEHILVGISSSPTNAKVIRTAARLVQSLHAEFSCVYVMDDSNELEAEDQERLQKNIELAEQLGGTVVILRENNTSAAIANYAKISGVTKVVLGKTMGKTTWFTRRKLTDAVNAFIPSIDLYIVPDYENAQKKSKRKEIDLSLQWLDFLKMICIFTCVALLGMFFQYLGLSESNIITIFILGVLIVAIWTTSWLMNIISSAIAVLEFNFLFTQPIFSFEAYHKDYPMTFFIMFLAGLLTSSLAKKIRKQEQTAIYNSYRIETLLDANRTLQSAKNVDELMNIGCQEMIKNTQAPIMLYTIEQKKIQSAAYFPCAHLTTQQNEHAKKKLANSNEQAIVQWCIYNQKAAGQTTNIFKDAFAYYVPFSFHDEVQVVLAITFKQQQPFSKFEKQIMYAILNELMLSYEQFYLLEENMKVAKEKELEQIQSNLLRSISHDLRTPLTSISGHASLLKTAGTQLTNEQKYTLYEDLDYNANRLIQLVENLLAASKISNGQLSLHIHEELIEDIFQDCLEQIAKHSERSIQVDIQEPNLSAKMDVRLIRQVIYNLLDNAIQHTEPHCHIYLKAYKENGLIWIEVRDNGQGISPNIKEALFHPTTFYHLKQHDAKRGLGIGLSLCQNILQIHQSELHVKDAIPHGAIFTFSLEKGSGI